MFWSIGVVVVVVVLLIICYIINTTIKPKKYPPGPTWYPIVGCSNIVHSFTKKHGSQYKGLLELSKKYATDILGLKLGSELVVVMSGKKNVRQAFTEKVFEGRPDNFFLRLRCLGKRLGITFTDGPLWRIHRQFAQTQLRNVGFGRMSMEKEIQSELQIVVEFLKKNKKPLSPNTFVSQAVMNVLWKFVAGEKIKKEMWKEMEELFKQRSIAFTMAGGLLSEVPWCRFIIPNLSGYTLITKLNKQISDIIEESINKHKRHEIKGKDFIYSFLEEMFQKKETFTEEQLKTVCLDMLIAGAQTTGNVLLFAFVEIIRNKLIQDKIHEEIDRVLGDNVPSWVDASKLVYTSAFLIELQRYHTIVPLAGPRRVLHDTVIDGYRIPKDTTVLISLGNIHCDAELWPDPYVLKPERFIGERGVLKNSEHMYPFGLGRRRCPGDVLAKSFIFLMFVGILQHFRVECSDGVLPSDEPHIGLIASPKPYNAQFIQRTKISFE